METYTTPPPRNRRIIVLLICVLLLVIGGITAWYFLRDTNKQSPTQNNGNNQNEQEPEPQPQVTCTDGPTEELRTVIRQAVTNQDPRMLRSWMAERVEVVVAASEQGDPVLPDQAVSDLSYLHGGIAPWNFEVPAETIAQYKNGFYAQYFTDTTYVGQSSNEYLVTFDFDSCGKISRIFMTSQASILTF